MNLIKFILMASILVSGCVKMPFRYIPAQDANAPRSVMPGTNNFGLTYTVRRNDTLDAIANQNNIPYQDLAKWNNISPPYNIFIGQTVILYPPQSDNVNNQTDAKQILPFVLTSARKPFTVTPSIMRESVGARTPPSELPQNGCEVNVVRIKTFRHNGWKNSFCSFTSACVGASYIIKNNSAQARIIDIAYASNDEERILHRALKIEGQSLFSDKIYDVDQTRDSWNIVITDCFW